MVVVDYNYDSKRMNREGKSVKSARPTQPHECVKRGLHYEGRNWGS